MKPEELKALLADELDILDLEYALGKFTLEEYQQQRFTVTARHNMLLTKANETQTHQGTEETERQS